MITVYGDGRYNIDLRVLPYQDTLNPNTVNYDREPNLRIEKKNNWPKGSVAVLSWQKYKKG